MKSSNKNILFYIINISIILIVSTLTIFNIIKENGIQTLSYIKNISLVSIVFLTFMFLLNYYLEGLIISVSMKEYNKDFDPNKGFIVHSVGALFSAITPLKSGYLPSVGYAYSKFNVKADEVIKSMAKTSYTYQICCLLLSIIAIVVCYHNEMIVEIGGQYLDLKNVALIGLIYNGVLLIGYFMLVLSPRLHTILIGFLSFILYKFKKIKNRNEYIESQKEKALIIRKEIKKYFKDVKQFLKIFVVYVIKILIYSSLPYVVYLLVANETFEIDVWLLSIIISNLISYITNIIPVPGASGTAEVVFVMVFSLIFFPSNILNSVMLIWRFFGYFLNIIVGFIIFIVLMNIKKKSSK